MSSRTLSGLGVALLLLLVLGSRSAANTSVPPPSVLALRPGERFDGLPPLHPPMRSDTVWFGGQDPSGLAFPGGIWDWDSDLLDPGHGWSSVDLTINPAVYFYWVIADSFLIHGDPCIPLFPDSSGMLWCGIHEDEALARDFPCGMGYQNFMCQRALSPELPFEPDLEPIEIHFDYFNDTEPDFDYTYVYVLCYDGAGEIVEEHLVDRLDGRIGSPESPATFSAQIAAGTLDPAGETLQLGLRVTSDGGWSDEDGRWDSLCGPFACDDLSIAIGWSIAQYGFDDGPQGWTFERCAGIGAYMAVVPEEVWTEWTEHAGVACGCPLDGNAVSFADLENSPFWPPGHPVGQCERAISNVIPRAGTPYQTPHYNVTIARWDHYAYMPVSTGGHYRWGWMVYPYTTELNPTPRWSPRLGMATWYYTGGSPQCAATGGSFTAPYDGTPIPATWDSMRVCYEFICSCDMFSTPPWQCEYEGETWGSPVLDNFRVGLTHAPDAPELALYAGHCFHDGFGQNFPLYLEPCDVGNSDISYDLSRDDQDQNDWLGDTALVIGPNVPPGAPPETYWACELCVRIARKGACQDRIPGYAEWKARFATDPEMEWACARMDSTQMPMGVHPSNYESYFHESDQGFDPAYGDRTPAQEILPDLIFTPGTRVEYHYRGYWYNGGAPPVEYSILGPWEFEILPGMRTIEKGSASEDGGDSDDGYDWQYPCVLYIDAFNRGAEYYIIPMLEELGLEFDVYDDLDASS